MFVTPDPIGAPLPFCTTNAVVANPRLPCLLALALMLLEGPVLPAQSAGVPPLEQPPPVNLEYDFRGGKPVPPDFSLAGSVDDLTARPEEGGLRLSLSGTRPNPIGRAGLEMKTALRGDFSITAGYEILQADPPTKGHGVGFELFALTVPKPQLGFGVYRMTRLDDGDVYYVSRNYLQNDGTPGWRNHSFPATVRSGHLRITRTGTEVTAWAAEGTSADFKALARDDMGDDIKAVWLMAYTGHVPHAIELRLTDVKIRSGVPVPAPPPDPRRTQRPYLWAVVILLMLLAGSVAAVWCYVRRQSNNSPDQA